MLLNLGHKRTRCSKVDPDTRIYPQTAGFSGIDFNPHYLWRSHLGRRGEVGIAINRKQQQILQ
jgi:hypothetical protein